jgi:hypothetical protein
MAYTDLGALQGILGGALGANGGLWQMQIKPPGPESALDWLDRRVNEIRLPLGGMSGGPSRSAQEVK